MKAYDKGAFFNEISRLIPMARIFRDQPLAPYTSFEIGGPADCLIRVGNDTELSGILQTCVAFQCPWMILGKGTNVLVADKGYRGLVIVLSGEFSTVQQEETTIIAGGGATLAHVASVAAQAGLAGFEFAHGIPGTVGGAVMMNAGAYGGEIKDILKCVRGMDENGTARWFDVTDLGLGYRSCDLQHSKMIIVKAIFSLLPGNLDQIRALTLDLQRRRWEKQPLDYPSAGSFFKRPPGHYAGSLIEQAGLKGMSIGGAQVSLKHAGFIVNTGGATAAQVIDLMHHIQVVVKERFDVDLVPEVKIIGEEGRNSRYVSHRPART